ncbi:unnamed protein product, partial [Ectocarpus sp. 8 AP-2014]
LRVYSTDPQPDLYHLTGTVHHVGETTNTGHYVVFVRQPGQGWRRHDDGRVSSVNEHHVLTKDALILS